ncbi:hypothetical protein [Aminobacter carboxidus]|uniref:hypothetical protein n=1 Tax=Aminobacter carboxidus TaxID=376165 RepID=UPI001FE70B99|nr:hypothetical protein [Aminobacter carboxidus]
MAENPLGGGPDIEALTTDHHREAVGKTRAGQDLLGMGQDRHHGHVFGLGSLQFDRAYSSFPGLAAWRNAATPDLRFDKLIFVSKISRQCETETPFAR